MNLSLESLQKRLLPFFESRPEIVFAYLFGSMATGRTNAMSDIDIAVYIDYSKIFEKDFHYGYDSFLGTELIGLLQRNDVDLVILNQASPVFQNQILTKGLKIFCRDSRTEEKVFVRSFHHYQNTSPLRSVMAAHQNRYLKSLGPLKENG